jgi:4-aminobutyrate aminotransferase-like enzyme
LEELQEQYEWIGEVRGMGLMQALELVEDRKTKEPSRRNTRAAMEATKNEQLLVGVGGLHGNVLRLGPSMLVTEGEVQDALGRLGRAFQTVDERS